MQLSAVDQRHTDVSVVDQRVGERHAGHAGADQEVVSLRPRIRTLAPCFDTCQIRSMSNQARADASHTAIGRQPLGRGEAVEIASLFKALSDPVRLQLLALIACHDDGEACVCDLTGAFELSPPTISHHLKVLREARMIAAERRGTWIYYRVEPLVLAQLAHVLVGAGLGTP